MTETEYYVWLGQEFKSRRESLGLNAAQVARRAGFNRALLSQFENDGKRISAYRINQLLRVLGLSSIEDMIKDSAKKKPLTLTLEGDDLGELTNGEKKSLLNDMKRFAKLLFSPEIYAELADEFQAKADAERAAKKHETTPEYTHEAGTSESSA